MSKTVGLAFIGCGEFARAMHLPLIKSNQKFDILACMDLCLETAKRFADEAGGYATNEIDEILSDPVIDAVLISTRHDSHSELTIKAANAGKHVLCEKPMALSSEECKHIAQVVQKANVVYTVGYNRGMAPMIEKAKAHLKELDGNKLMIYHRIQAPFPEDSWTHDPKIGGGRFVGEGCHIFDLLCELVPSPPMSVYASGGTFLNPTKVHIADSAIVTITFADGSVGCTLINSAGTPAFPKESTEIYCNNRAIHISDFRHMECYGFDENKKVIISYEQTDKGHKAEIDRFANAILDGTPTPNGLVQAARAAIISYKVLESLASGQPIEIKTSEYEF